MDSLFFCGDDGAGQPLRLVLGRDRTILGPDRMPSGTQVMLSGRSSERGVPLQRWWAQTLHPQCLFQLPAAFFLWMQEADTLYTQAMFSFKCRPPCSSTVVCDKCPPWSLVWRDLIQAGCCAHSVINDHFTQSNQ